MNTRQWPVALALLAIAVLGSYLLYTEQLVREFRIESEVHKRMYAIVQQGLLSTEPRAELVGRWSDTGNIPTQALQLLSGLEIVSEALRRVRPYALDVSGGVESAKGIKDPAKIFCLALCKVEFLIIDAYMNANPVGCIQYLGEIFRIAVLPPSYTGLVRVIHTGDVAAA